MLIAVPITGCVGSSSPPAPAGVESSSKGEDKPERAPKFVLDGLVLSAEEVGLGESITVTTTVRNVGTDAGTVIVIPLWDGSSVKGTQELDLLVGKSKNLTFEVVATAGGDHLVGVQVAGETPVTAPVSVLVPDVKITRWKFTNPYCENYLDLEITLENVGGSIASNYTLDVYSTDRDGRQQGHAAFEVPDLASKVPGKVTGEIFAPQKCGTGAMYTLTFILAKDGGELHRETTDPFIPVSS